ncbi:MAG: Stp1/IreP family PP2C-type Ser/Thr phosphatase [Bacteroidales bacterium]|nr:Stp1/IreP family PP2C-type Ser/Thr phosphatase [Bacteroidales bacterium]
MTKTQQLKNFSYFGGSHIGNVREENEDAFTHFETVNGSFFVLCDGMGGIKGGKKAAEITIKQIEKYLSEEWEENPQILIKNAIEFANNKVFEYFEKRSLGQKPGTTIVLVLIRNNKVYYAHVGDSRVYYQTGKKIFALTQDHSFVMNLVNRKIITENEAREHIRRNEITKAVGIKEFADPSVCKDFISPVDNDYILLCSDGLTNELTNKEILNILLNNKDIDKKVNLLINNALDNGGDDNITVQLIRFYNTGKETNTDFLKKQSKSKKVKTRFFYLFVFLFLVSSVLIIRYFIKDPVVVKKDNKSSSALLIYKKQSNDTLINVFIKAGSKTNDIHKRFNIQPEEIGRATGLSEHKSFIKYYIPVKDVYKKRVGKYIYSYPDIKKRNMIDILIANKKNELFFIPGEIIIIPKKQK